MSENELDGCFHRKSTLVLYAIKRADYKGQIYALCTTVRYTYRNYNNFFRLNTRNRRKNTVCSLKEWAFREKLDEEYAGFR